MDSAHETVTDVRTVEVHLVNVQTASPYRAVNTLRPSYKNQSVNVV